MTKYIVIDLNVEIANAVLEGNLDSLLKDIIEQGGDLNNVFVIDYDSKDLKSVSAEFVLKERD